MLTTGLHVSVREDEGSTLFFEIDEGSTWQRDKEKGRRTVFADLGQGQVGLLEREGA